MNDREKDFLKTVNEDIQELRKTFSGNIIIKDGEIRSSSVVLRKLLIEDDFYTAWKVVKLEGQPKIQFEELSNLVDISRKSEIAMAVCGGAKYNGAEVKGFKHVLYAMTEAEIKESAKDKSVRIAKNTKGFINSLCCIINGQEVTRREVIKYFANNCGGAHYV